MRVNYRGDSLQPADYDSIDNGGRGDATHTLPGFLKPSATNRGWPKAVDNYLKLNFSDVRAHQVPWTPYMLDVADEMGLMVMDETAIRGSNVRETFEGEALDNMTQHLRDLVLRDRNHASVLRWSQSNEPGGLFGGNAAPFPLPFPTTPPGAGRAFDEALYKTVMAVDPTRPVSTDFTAFDLPYDNYTTFCHYDSDVPPLGVLGGTGKSTPTSSARTAPRRANRRARASTCGRPTTPSRASRGSAPQRRRCARKARTTSARTHSYPPGAR